MSEEAMAKGLVGTSTGMTLCLPGFQSVRIDCWALMPSTGNDAEDVYEKCCQFASSKVEAEVLEIYEHFEDSKGTIGKVE